MLKVVLFGMNFLVLLEILGALESFLTNLKHDERGYFTYRMYCSTHFAHVGFKWRMDCGVRDKKKGKVRKREKR
jgi:hypothetical protein